MLLHHFWCCELLAVSSPSSLRASVRESSWGKRRAVSLLSGTNCSTKLSPLSPLHPSLHPPLCLPLHLPLHLPLPLPPGPAGSAELPAAVAAPPHLLSHHAHASNGGTEGGSWSTPLRLYTPLASQYHYNRTTQGPWLIAISCNSQISQYAVDYIISQYITLCHSISQYITIYHNILQYITLYYIISQQPQYIT